MFRTKAIPTGQVMSKVNDEGGPRCRRRKRDMEKRGNILEKCQNTKNKRIHRHDEIKKLLEGLAKKYLVLDESEIAVNGARY